MLAAAPHATFLTRDPAEIVAAFSRLPVNWTSGSWLSSLNKYRFNCTQLLKKGAPDPRRGILGTPLIHKHLSEYIAASTVIHCWDGWSYLGRAIHSLMSGDHDAARHLGYYAELRAAMSILAREGVGVFSEHHVVVGPKGRCSYFPNKLGTHVFAWDALGSWLSSPNSSASLLDIVTGGGSNLNQWISHIGVRPGFTRSLAEDWLLSWGLDLQRFLDDRAARNISSYRPTSFTTGRPVDVASVSKFVQNLWQLTEPTTIPFNGLDRILIRDALRQAFIAANGSPTKSSKKFSTFIDSILNFLQPREAAGQSWEIFLKEAPPTPKENILTLAARNDSPKDPWHAIQVVSRAFLMLRIATGFGQNLISSLAPGVVAGMEFWVKESGEDRGLWKPNERPESMGDLWIDAEDAIAEIRENPESSLSYYDFWKSNSSGSKEVLASCERVCLWGLRL